MYSYCNYSIAKTFEREAKTMPGTRGAGTAAAIEDAALDLVLQRGYDQVTVDMICAVAGVSQRTFFNHFPTKDDAVLGRDAPHVDSQAARRFLVSTGPIVQDALTLVAMPPASRSSERLTDRMRVVSVTPSLLAGHLARIATIDDEVRHLVFLRLGLQAPECPEDRRRDEAEMVTSLLGAVMRWVAVTSSRDTDATAFADLMARARTTLEDVIRMSLPPDLSSGSRPDEPAARASA